jgi:hypothetical protein
VGRGTELGLYRAFYIPNILYKRDAEEKINDIFISTNTSNLTFVVRISKRLSLTLNDTYVST